MRLLVCTEFFHSRVGGAERILQSIVQEMVKRSHAVTVCSFESSGKCSKCRSQGINHIDFTTVGPVDLSFRAIAMVPSFENYDAVFAQHYYHFSSFFASMVSRYHHAPLVIKPIGIYFRGNDLTALLYKGLESTQGRFCLCSASLLLPTTRFEAKILQAKGVQADKIRVVRSGANMMSKPSLEEIQVFARRFEISSDPVVLFVGRLERLKGVETLLEAMLTVADRFPRVQCVLAGDEDNKFMARLLARPRYSKLRLIRTGYLSQRQLNAAYALATIFVLPSLTELSSLTLKEAQLAQLPVIATNVGGNPEYVRDGISGILVEPGKEEDLAREIVVLLEDESLRESLGRAGYNSASGFSADSCVNMTIDAISEVTRR